MSLLNTASIWNDKNNNSTSRKRLPQLKRINNNTSKVRPYDRPNFNSFDDSSNFFENTNQNNESNDNSNHIKNIIEKLSFENDGDSLSDFQPLQPPDITVNSNPEIDHSIHFVPDDLLPKTLEKEKSNFSNNDIPTLNLCDYNHSYSAKKPTHINHNTHNYTDNKVLDKINYMIHLLEEQQIEKTANITEEFILYTFLGVFVIFIVDSFTKAGKYTR